MKSRKTGSKKPDLIFYPEQYLKAHEAMHQLRIVDVEKPAMLADAMDSFISLQHSPNEKSAEPRRKLAESTIKTAGYLSKITKTEEREEKTLIVKEHRVQSFEGLLFGGSHSSRKEEKNRLDMLKARGFGSSVLKKAGKNTFKIS